MLLIWLDDGIIVPAKPSAWNLPMTVTFKKNLDGTKTDKIRLVLDPRMLNKVLPVDNHQLPLINDIFNSMTDAVVFSTLDLKSAFNQFPVFGPDQHKTTFTAPNNLQYMYRGAPFGISTISQLFSRIMLNLFKDLPYVKCFVDDICVFSSSMHAHFLHFIFWVIVSPLRERKLIPVNLRTFMNGRDRLLRSKFKVS
ncbi:hypothetical protein G6F22_016941 [Rhizopus arrhizus]|nr:hypothetical protein G6F22_016941 [Rhizopus arrhizus]KAG1185309.1 hypothetical protein G6F35_014897 [Rhizopus arrhizus]